MPTPGPWRPTRRSFLGWTSALAAGTLVACADERGGRSGPSGVPDPEAFVVTRWGRDPHALGAYSYLARGSSPADRAALAEPVGGRLFFAGEATSLEYPATVHGALLSGVRAADEALDAGAERAIVIGAGAAGLAAASALSEEDLDVMVLEARDRVGGRIWTDTSLGPALDLGASWIHGVDGNPLTEIADDEDVALAPFDYDDIVVYDAHGRRVNDVPDADDVLDGGFATGDPRIGEYAVASQIEHEFAADFDSLSPEALDEGEEFAGGDALIPAGYSALADATAADLDIRLSTPVEEVAHDEDGVRVRGAGSTFVADAAVVTLPLGVLQASTVRFSPDLPAAKAAAIERLGMGLLDKVALRFPEVFWDNAALIGYVNPERGEWIEWLNAEPLTGEPILVAFNAGSVAERFEAMRDDEVVASAVRALDVMYG